MREQGIPYPVAVDVDKQTQSAYFVDGFPDYHIIDRAGNLRVADCQNSGVEAVVRALLAEPDPFALPEVLRGPAEVAKKKDKRVLGLLGSDAARQRVRGGWSSDRDVAQFVRYEYEVVDVAPAEVEGLMTAALFGVAPPAGDVARLVAFDANGVRLGAVDLAPGGGDGRAFLEEHRVPVKDAEVLLKDALGRAKAEKKRVLVHLGAPW